MNKRNNIGHHMYRLDISFRSWDKEYWSQDRRINIINKLLN